MSSLPDSVAPCTLHDKECRVPQRMDVHVCGFSCRDLSKLNSCWSKEEKQHILQQGLGTTGKTFASLINK